MITKQAVLGWCITKEHEEPVEGLSSRIGYGQVGEQRGNDYTTGIDPETIADPLPWVASYDGEGPAYSGVISREWAEGDEDQCFGPLEFATLDVGATDLTINGEAI